MTTTQIVRQRTCALIIVSAAFALPAWAAAATATEKTDKPSDYSFSAPLQISGKQGVVGVRVPQAVYLNVKTARLDDVRVFDANGVAQPFSIQRPQPETRTQRTLQAVSVFPIRSSATPNAESGIELDIRTGSDGKVISVRTNNDSPAETASSSDLLSGLILDFGAQDESTETVAAQIAALHFAAPENKPNYNAEVWLEISKDLKTWETIGAADIGWLTNDNAQTLSNDRLEFHPFSRQAFRYARLTWRKGDPVLFPAIEAEQLAVKPTEAQRETLWIKPAAGKIGSDLAYPAGIGLPVDQVSLKLSEPNVVFPMTLGKYVERPSRITGKKTEWVFQPIVRSTFYQIEQNEQTRRSGPLTIGLTQQQEWVIRPQNASATAKPELGLSWQPDTLVFLAGGTPPYRIFFGRADATPANQPLAQVAPGFSSSELKQLEMAKLGEVQTMNAKIAGESASELASQAARNRRLALWSLLILGVLVLGGMTWRLIGQMKARPSEADKPPA